MGDEIQIINLMNTGQYAEAGARLAQWLRWAIARQDHPAMALLYEHLANLQLLYGLPAHALVFLREALTVRRRLGDFAGVARLSWSIGAYEMACGSHQVARRYLIRAVALAEELNMPQARTYRIRRRLLECQP